MCPLYSHVKHTLLTGISRVLLGLQPRLCYENALLGVEFLEDIMQVAGGLALSPS